LLALVVAALAAAAIYFGLTSSIPDGVALQRARAELEVVEGPVLGSAALVAAKAPAGTPRRYELTISRPSGPVTLWVKADDVGGLAQKIAALKHVTVTIARGGWEVMALGSKDGGAIIRSYDQALKFQARSIESAHAFWMTVLVAAGALVLCLLVGGFVYTLIADRFRGRREGRGDSRIPLSDPAIVA
jgi:hypothetical protein